MTTMPQGDLPRDLGILRAAADHNRSHISFANQDMPSVGVYARVLRGGRSVAATGSGSKTDAVRPHSIALTSRSAASFAAS
jgi:hypothetical protein